MLFTLSHMTSMRPIALPILVALLFSSLGGCGTEKRARECVSRCEAEGEACERRREPNCASRGRACAEGCERNAAKASF
jgi:hypothetical protein